MIDQESLDFEKYANMPFLGMRSSPVDAGSIPQPPGLAQSPPSASSPGVSEYAGEDIGISPQVQMLEAILQELRSISQMLRSAST